MVEKLLSEEEKKKISTFTQEKLWTDRDYSGDSIIRGFSPLPVGIQGSKCPKCGSRNLRGVLITVSADESDPNILCIDCGYWRD